MKACLLAISIMSITTLSHAQTIIPLYEKIPNSKPGPDIEKSEIDPKGLTRISEVTSPTLSVFLPPKDKANGTAVIICPGGGYARLAFSHEGTDVAKKFNEMGIAAFVLKYRLPDDLIMVNKETGPVQDAQRAIQVVRERAAEWSIDKKRVGLMGFSAGGHLASTAGTHFNHHYTDTKKNINLRPDFLILIYPVISFADSIAHKGSRTRLLGEHPSPEKVREYSNELQVTKNTPPTFLVHAKDDKVVPVENGLLFYKALQEHHVPSSLYLYEKGGHGFGMNNPTSDVKWMEHLQKWMQEQKIIP